MNRTMRTAVAAALTAALGAGTASAHGWYVPGGAGSPGVVAPVGGGGAQAGAGGGSSFGQPGVGGGTSGRPTNRPTAGGGGRDGLVEPAGRGVATPAPKPVGRGGGGTPARRPVEDPLADAIRVRWTPAFLPFLRHDGYAGVEATLDESMRHPTKIWTNGARYFDDLLAAADDERKSAYAGHIDMASGLLGGRYATDPMDVPRAIAEIIALPPGARPLRKPVHPNTQASDALNAAHRQVQAAVMGQGPYKSWHDAVTD